MQRYFSESSSLLEAISEKLCGWSGHANDERFGLCSKPDRNVDWLRNTFKFIDFALDVSVLICFAILPSIFI
jgi:hypothetical protein